MEFGILVVDDEEDMRGSLEDLFGRQGYEVHLAAEALKKIAAIPFDLVLADIVMSEISGMELLRRIKEISPDSSVLMITGLAESGTAVEAMKLGAEDYITKPLSPSQHPVDIEDVLLLS